MGRAALEAIDRHAARHGADAGLAARVRAEFAEKIARDTPSGPAVPEEAESARKLRLAAIHAERVMELREGVLHQVR